jgi:CRP-like cAMP-binding protein
MSASTQPSTDDTPSNEELSKEQRLRNYLRDQAEQKGELYFKSKFIAEDVGLSAKEIGALMVKLRDSAADLEIEKWSYTSATTWRISPA